ncbi:MAG TPA: Fur family transcriptional regulator [Lachnospiraceae bacterium]|nr:Fur family transcriptional regulator [Lachnospiraceae bacterium]
MEKYLAWYKEIIKKNGMKNTIQKEAVLIVLIKASSHLTVEEIYQQIKEVKIGLATIYRSLKLFEDLGIVKEIPMDGVRYYELKLFGKKPLHIHFKCLSCNAMTDIDDTETNLDYIRLNQKVEHKMGVEVNDANITLLGLCKGCREKLKG